MANPAHEQPDWSGLQVNEAAMSTPAPQVSTDHEEKQLNDKSPLDYFAQQDKFTRISGTPDEKVAITPGLDHAKIVAEPPSLGSVGNNSEFSDEKQARIPQHKLLPKTKKNRRRLWILLAVMFFIIAVVIAVPCGVLLSQKAQQSSMIAVPIGSNGTSVNDSPTSALNGTRITSFQPPGSGNEIWMFWQNSAGDIRMTQRSESGTWSKSISMNATNASNLTSLAVGAHVWSGNTIGLYHLVYQTNDGYYSDLINDPTQGPLWRDGGLNSRQRQWSEVSPRQFATWAMYGNGTGFIYVGGPNSGWYNEWEYDATTTNWLAHRFLFQNTSAMGGCAVQQINNETALRVVSPHGEIISYYRNLTSSASSLDDWQRVANGVSGLFPNTSLATTHGENFDPYLVYYQDSSGHVTVAQSSGYDSNAVWQSQTPTIMQPLGGSALHAIALANGSSVQTHMFFQQQGNDIAHWAGNSTAFSFVESVPLD